MNSQSRGKSPPFSKHLRPGYPELTVYVGSKAWRRARDASHTAREGRAVACPPDSDPACFTWSKATFGLPVLVVRAGVSDPEQELRLAASLFRDGATRVVVIGGETPTHVYR